MCGIVGAIAQREVMPILMEGLRRLEYRGYDSAGMALMGDGAIKIKKTSGRIAALEEILDGGEHPPDHIHVLAFVIIRMHIGDQSAIHVNQVQ